MTSAEPAEKLLSPVLSASWDDQRPWTLETYRRHGGYDAWPPPSRCPRTT